MLTAMGGNHCKNSQKSLNEILDSREEALRKATLQGVVNDLVREKIINRLSDSSQVAGAGRPSYDASVELLANTGITITNNALCKRVNSQFRKSQQASSSTALDSSTGCNSSKATAAAKFMSSTTASEVTAERNALRRKIRTHFRMPRRASNATPDSSTDIGSGGSSTETPATDEINATTTVASSTPEAVRPGRETDIARNAPRRKVRTHFQMSPRASSSTTRDDSLVPKAKKKPGVPVDPKITRDAKRRNDCITAIAIAYSTELSAASAKGARRRSKNGFAEELIARKKLEYGVEGAISSETIRSIARDEEIRYPNTPKPSRRTGRKSATSIPKRRKMRSNETTASARLPTPFPPKRKRGKRRGERARGDSSRN